VPLVIDPAAFPSATLETLARSLREELAETRGLIDSPPGTVVDPESLRTARELLDAALARVAADGPDTRERWAADANLAYATLLAVIDLVKSHTDVPRVPRARPKAGSPP
jgi:hypothetical protein